MSLKIVFMGTPEFSIPALTSLVNSSHKVILIYSQPPKKSYRGQKINKSPVQNFAEIKKIPARTPSVLDNDEEYKILEKLNPDLVVVVAYGKIIPSKFLTLPKYGFINIHASLLPKWRGAAPIQRSIMESDVVTGVSIMKITDKLDVGPIFSQSTIKIDDKTNSYELEKKLSNLGSKLLLNCIEKIESNQTNCIEQDHSKATYAKKIEKSESRIEWDLNAKNILAKINGLNPNPGAWFLFKKIRYKIWNAKISEAKGKPGKILDSHLTVGCKDKSIKILEIQREGKRKQGYKDFILGSILKKGCLLD